MRAPIALCLCLAACRSGEPADVPEVATPVPADSASPAAEVAAAPGERGTDESVTPVFPSGAVTPSPLAERLCAALHVLPAQARAACCPGSTAPPDLAAECVRTLSIALNDHTLTLDEAALERCEVATRAKLVGCDWVTPLRALSVPACGEVVHGLGAAGATCRSSLECGDGLFCLGLGPTAAGRCTAAQADGAACGPITDVLADMSGQEPSLAAAHPSCNGYCHARRCVARVALGDACTYRAACGTDARCAAGHCIAGRTSKLGEACDQGSPCTAGSVCHGGACVALKKTGEACAVPFECEANCNTGADKKAGVCGPRCGP